MQQISAGKFDGEVNLAGGRVETAKLKSANIILPATRNDVMHAVVFLPSAHTTLAVHIAWH